MVTTRTSKPPSPLLGYNTNVKYRNRVYHVQTEDSGVKRPHVITHLFADGGRIIASRKSGYAEHIGTSAYPQAVKKMMQDQHKAMLHALKGGEFDVMIGEAADEPSHVAIPLTSAKTRQSKPQVSPPAIPQKHRTSLSQAELRVRSLDEIILSYVDEDD